MSVHADVLNPVMAENTAYKCRITADQVQERAWDACVSARKSLKKAELRRRDANAWKSEAWNQLQCVRAANQPVIDVLAIEQRRAEKNIQTAARKSRAAYDHGNDYRGSAYAEKENQCRASMSSLSTECNRLIQQITSAKAEYQEAVDAYHQADKSVGILKAICLEATTRHKDALAAYNQAKIGHDLTIADFSEYVDTDRADSNKMFAAD